MFLAHQINTLEQFLNDHDTEDWNNDAVNSALLLQKKIHFKETVK